MTAKTLEQEARKCRCRDCGWKGMASEMAEVSYSIYVRNCEEVVDRSMMVCPDCGECDSTVEYACDEYDCWQPATCGTPTANGYRNTCHKHSPDRTA